MPVTHKQLDTLWSTLQDAIDRHASADTPERGALLDFHSHSAHGMLGKLLERETAHERRHRQGWGTGIDGSPHAYRISARDGARVLLLYQVALGAQQSTMPSVLNFLNWRDTAAEAHLLGYLLRDALPEGWVSECAALDYAAEMKA